MTNARLNGAALLLGLAILMLVAIPASAQWVEFVNESGSRMSSSGSVGLSDTREKDYAWGDVDKDGDIDLVVVRKQEWTSAGKNTNVLFINENGVLTDRTSDFATDSSVGGDNGFLTATNDRDVALADLNNDGWLDMVTATTISFGDPKHIGYPRVYMNLGCSGACNGTADWNGFRFENNRMPSMQTWNGSSNVNPCFCSVSIGDVDGDGYNDLYFGDYDSGGGGQAGTCGNSSNDFNDKLLLNQGAGNPGFFSDVTNSRFSGNVPGFSQEFPVSAFGAANAVADMNGNNVMDIVKQTSLSSPTYVGIAYNDTSPEGFFDQFESVNNLSPYFVSASDLNNDNDMDLIITDDGADRYMINQGTGGDGMANWTSFVFSFSNPQGSSGDQGFGGNSIARDLDNDGWNDVLITDVDVDISGCGRRMSIYRNLGGAVGSNVTLQEITQGSGCQTFAGNPSSCIVTTIPANMLEGVHDVAVFDINNDTALDMVVGRCSTTEIWMGVPAGDPVGGVPDGDTIPGAQLVAGRSGASNMMLSWGDSCVSGDDDYEIYEGRIGEWYSHSRKFCSTGGSATETFTPGNDSSYYLVVPTNGVFEGPYGSDSEGTARPVGAPSCTSQAVGTCE